MEDVLQPRSRRSWDVLKEWFRIAGGNKNASATTVTTIPSKDAPENSTSAVETLADADKISDDSPGMISGRSPEIVSGRSPDIVSGRSPLSSPDDEAVDSNSEQSTAHGWRVVECRVDNNGSCGSCGEMLRSIELSEDDEKRLLKQVGFDFTACCM